jgi:exodeoxyribonuclease VII small subunit
VTDSELTYEQAIDRLEETLKRMESDKLSLDEAVKAAEDAQRYFRICVQRLEEARKRIEVRAETEATE